MANNNYYGILSGTSSTRFKDSAGWQDNNKQLPDTTTKAIDRRSLAPTGLTTQALNALATGTNIAKIRLISQVAGDTLPEEHSNKEYIGFILTNVSESSTEKFELIPLPGDSFTAYFYGRSPRTYTVQGVLLNTVEDAWRDAFETMYEEYLRGTKSATLGRVCQLKYDNRIVTGWPLQMSMSLDSASDIYATFNMSILVTRVDILGNTKPNMYMRKAPELPNTLFSESQVAELGNIVRTGYTIPPPRPRSGGGRSAVSGDCFLVAPQDAQGTDQGSPSGNTASTSLSAAATCSYTATYRDTAAAYHNANLELGKKDITDARRRELSDRVTQYKTDLEAIENSAEFKSEVKGAIGSGRDGTFTLGTRQGTKESVTVQVDGDQVTVRSTEFTKPGGSGVGSSLDQENQGARAAHNERVKKAMEKQQAAQKAAAVSRQPKVRASN